MTSTSANLWSVYNKKYSGEKCDLRAEKDVVLGLARRLYNGDWSASELLIQKHMRVCFAIAKNIATQYHQDLDDMVGEAYLGLVDACVSIYKHEATLDNPTGLLITRARGRALNARIDRNTGFKLYEVRRHLESGVPMRTRRELHDDMRSAMCSRQTQIDMFDSFLPLLSDQEFDVFVMMLKGYSDLEIAIEISRSRATVSNLKKSINAHFERWVLEWMR